MAKRSTVTSFSDHNKRIDRNFMAIRVLEIIGWCILPFVVVAIFLQLSQEDFSLTFTSSGDNSRLFVGDDINDTNFEPDVIADFVNLVNGTTTVQPTDINSIVFEIVLDPTVYTFVDINQSYGLNQEELFELKEVVVKEEGGIFIPIQDFNIFINPVPDGAYGVASAEYTFHVQDQVLHLSEGDVIRFHDYNPDDGVYSIELYNPIDPLIGEQPVITITAVVPYANQVTPDDFVDVTLTLYNPESNETFNENGFFTADFAYDDQASIKGGKSDLGFQYVTPDLSVTPDPDSDYYNPFEFWLPTFAVQEVTSTFKAFSLTLAFIFVLMATLLQLITLVTYARHWNKQSNEKDIKKFKKETQSYLVYKSILSWFCVLSFALLFVIYLAINPNFVKFLETGNDAYLEFNAISIISSLAVLALLVTFAMQAFAYTLLIVQRNRQTKLRIRNNHDSIPEFGIYEADISIYEKPDPINTQIGSSKHLRKDE